MGKIKSLSPDIVAKIAAGEVVERPGSVVKELVENSLDAGGREIKVEIQGGGRKLIRVTDDGEGMSSEDALLAPQRHSTSKLSREEDLRAIRTFGFRGEALSAIAAVSRMRIVTRNDRDLTGIEVVVEGGSFREPREVGCPLGTSVEIRDLFFNVPARLKFLKTPGTELGHVAEVVTRAALAHGDVHFQFFHDGRLLANYPVRENLSSRLTEALGQDAGERMHFFQSRQGDLEVEGYAGEPGFDRPNGRGIYLFVNRRPVRDRLLTHAILEGYRNLIPKDRYPVALLFVQLPPSEVDVNIHPSKWEVKFSEAERVHRAVVRAIRSLFEKDARFEEPGERERLLQREVRETPAFYPSHGAAASLPFRYAEVSGLESGLESREELPEHPFLGQIDRTYLLFQGPEGLTLMDQHAAHERVVLERLLDEFGQGSIRRQRLLLPEMIELSLRESKATEEHIGDLEKMGFEVEPSGARSFWVKSVPEILATREPLAALKELIQQIASWGENADLRGSMDPLFHLMACRSAVQAPQKMGREEAMALLADLRNCRSPARCPHGRPTLIKITLADLEKMFQRK